MPESVIFEMFTSHDSLSFFGVKFYLTYDTYL